MNRLDLPDFLLFVLLTFIQLFILLNIVPLTTSYRNEPGWLQICSSSETFRVHAGGCPRGVWLKRPMLINCVCVNGVWALSKGPCDESPILLVGRGSEHCFTLNTHVDSIKFIGKPSDPFSPSEYLGPSFLNSFWQLPKGKESNTINDLKGPVAMLSINSQLALQAKKVGCCRKHAASTNKVLLLCLVQPGSHYQAVEECSDPNNELDFTIGLAYGEALRINGNYTETLLADKECSMSCGYAKPSLQTDCCKSLDFEDLDEELALDEKRVNDQTARIASRQIDWTLFRKKGPRIEHPEFVYLQKARKLFATLCPSNVIPTFVLNSLIRLFRFILIETMAASPLIKHFNPARHQRILTSLNKCLGSSKGAKPMGLEFSEEPNTEEDGNSSSGCMRKVKTVTVNKKGGSSTPITPEIPVNQTFQPLLFDFPLETAWKVMSFTHYYCSEHFKANPSDHSQLIISLESFFTPQLLNRWANPGKSYQVMELLFDMYNLPLFANALDACVAGAREVSTYKEWILRPTLRRVGPRPGTRDLGEVWEGDGYCLDSYWDPIEKYGAGDQVHPETGASCYPENIRFYQV